VDESSLESLCERLAAEVAKELEDHPGKLWRCPRDLDQQGCHVLHCDVVPKVLIK